ncbi:phage tail protein [Escherichia fergusonii]|nr:phage tail protein [Escherichia fergusonii]
MSNFMSFIDEFGQQQAENLRSAGTTRVMMMLGDFAFSIDTTAYNQLTREATWRWSEQERIGKQDLLQYTGKPGRTVRLEGESHAFFRKGVGPVNDLFALADQAKPLQLVSGEGDVLGWWVVTDFTDTTNRFLPGGGHRNKNWTMTLKHYADDISNP